jgi:hypothetical protein
MNQKPNDLLLSVIEFFGILIPGAVLAFLHGNFLLGPLGLSMESMQKLDTSGDWVLAFFVSIVLGHLLHSLSDPLDTLAGCYLSARTQRYLEAVRPCSELPAEVPENPKNLFYSAFSFIRIHSPVAVSELERHAADYKLFRSLTLLFLLDIPLSAFSGSFSLVRLAASFLVVCFAAFRFKQLFDWTYALAFDLYWQVSEVPEKNRKATAKKKS